MLTEDEAPDQLPSGKALEKLRQNLLATMDNEESSAGLPPQYDGEDWLMWGSAEKMYAGYLEWFKDFGGTLKDFLSDSVGDAIQDALQAEGSA
jgi:hypothetical protein